MELKRERGWTINEMIVDTIKSKSYPKLQFRMKWYPVDQIVTHTLQKLNTHQDPVRQESHNLKLQLECIHIKFMGFISIISSNRNLAATLDSSTELQI